jgi:alpha-galactosidase
MSEELFVGWNKELIEFGEITAVFLTAKGITTLCLVPTSTKQDIKYAKVAHLLYPQFGHSAPMPMVDVALTGDGITRTFGAGNYMHTCSTSQNLKFVKREIQEESACKRVITHLYTENGVSVEHILEWNGKDIYLSCYTKIINNTNGEIQIEALPSFQISGISPFCEDNESENIVISEFLNNWSCECRLRERTAAELCMYDSWSHFGMRGYRIGQKGSMPARGNIPFLAVTDKKYGVVWAAKTDASASWQMEVIHNTNAISLSGGLADFNFGHWRKKIAEGESFTSEKGYITCIKGTLTDACNNLVKTQTQKTFAKSEADFPLIYNEYLGSMGNPDIDKLRELMPAAAEFGAKYFVMDAGWYNPIKGEWENIGDWQPNNQRFPKGLKEYSDEVRKHGMIPGIWYEFEGVSFKSQIAESHPEYLLKLDGKIINHGNRGFFDFRLKEVNDYLAERVINLLKNNKIGYLKVDYNENIGLGNDGCESYGEGLREQIACVGKFYERIKSEVKDIVLEVCSSGGMRHTEYWLNKGDMCSFSDAHFTEDGVPIAIGLHRFIAPRLLQIWGEVNIDHSDDKCVFTMCKAMLGRVCLSGAVNKVSSERKEIIKKAMDFYLSVNKIIALGATELIKDEVNDITKLEEKSFALVKSYDNEKLVYAFFIKASGQSMKFNTDGYIIKQSYGNISYKTKDGELEIINDKSEYAGMIVHLIKEENK